jgi:hypothetical protein
MEDMPRKWTARRFILCVKNDNCDGLEKRKVYCVLVGHKAEKDGYLGVIDESGDDYLYPASSFDKVELP